MEITYITEGVIILFTTMFIYLLIKYSRNARRYRGEVRQLQSKLQEALDENDTKNVVKSNIDLLKKHHQLNMSQYRITNQTTLGIAVIGVITILIGIIFYFEHDNQSAGRITTISGVIVEILSTVFFYLNRKSRELIRENHQALVSELDIQHAISLAESLPKTRQNDEMSKIIDHLLHRTKIGNIISEPTPEIVE